ncbi:hypothetical protein CEUSTIGMA_g8615.t1 [Chlamydomonas eustigma]|uniref:Protein kinase domain-containing protein n=1 Tax=Chlamydomonas eustigma TaxID=1157962 RepID=A0A250XE56_9CHLO|nr:hypothetical protein CEUSTIGMA_g8615.t1 [Chlamydomonas eustigma]|eukprot:GAX81182.1 hypothetical protein CEUSTIGMA_g8615.t1 [Chlamydomonas eustigma]
MGICASKSSDKYLTDQDIRTEKVVVPKASELSCEIKLKQPDNNGSQLSHVDENIASSDRNFKLADHLTPLGAPSVDLIGNLIDPVNGPACGLPYKVHYLGPPRPPCEAERLATTQAIGRLNDPDEDPEIINILRLCSNIFQAPASLCALFDEQQVFISEQEGNIIPRGEFPWRWTLCGWSLAFKNPQILVIPDTHQDVRFANNLKVTKPPHVRFYCGAPLIASNGHRLGTLCFADVKPRDWDAGSCMIMNNLSELVVRQLEKNLALKAKAKDNEELTATFGHLQRALDAFDHCVMLLDTSSAKGWKVLYANAILGQVTGYQREDVIGQTIEQLFEDGAGGSVMTQDLMDAISSNKAFRVRLARTKAKDLTHVSGALMLSFRPASRNPLDDHTMPIGIPSFLPVKNDSHACNFYFVTIDAAGHSSQGTVLRNISCYSILTSPAQLEGLDMGHLLGKGTFGRVYYATWFGTPVAVKVINSEDTSRTSPMLEAVLSSGLKHPLIVSTLKYFHQKVAPTASSIDTASTISHHSFSLLNSSADSVDTKHDSATSSKLVKHLVSAAKNATCMPPLSLSDNSTKEIDGGGIVAQGGVGQNTMNTFPEEATRLTRLREIGPCDSCGTSSSQGGWAVINFSRSESVIAEENEETEGSHASHTWGSEITKTIAQDIHPPVHKTQSAVASRHLSSMTKVGGPCRSSHMSNLTSEGDSKQWRQTWMIMEYADRGCLQDAIDRGHLCADRFNLSKGPNLQAVLATAHEIATAMRYLHQSSVVHGDLSGWNIMLSSSGDTASQGGRNFVAKVADFGLSRSLEVGNRVMTQNYGTLSHQPPETLTKGIVSSATDVYSYGVLLWQMYTGSRPWSGLSQAQIMLQVGSQGSKLKWPQAVPPEYKALADACMHWEADQRPKFEDIVIAVQAMRSLVANGSMRGTLHGAWE